LNQYHNLLSPTLVNHKKGLKLSQHLGRVLGYRQNKHFKNTETEVVTHHSLHLPKLTSQILLLQVLSVVSGRKGNACLKDVTKCKPPSLFSPAVHLSSVMWPAVRYTSTDKRSAHKESF